VRNPKAIAAGLGTLVLLVVGFLFFRSPKPVIEIKAERIAEFGPFPLVNTYTKEASDELKESQRKITEVSKPPEYASTTLLTFIPTLSPCGHCKMKIVVRPCSPP